MFQITFNQTTLPKANRYLILVTTNNQTRRTEVCNDWTSNPQFSTIELGNQIGQVELKVCEASTDRKLKIIGSGKVTEEMMTGDDPVFQGEVKIQQKIQGNTICVGICHIKIAEKVQFQEVQPIISNASIESEGKINEETQAQQFLEEEEEEKDQEVRFEFHCGMNFYLGSSFSVQVRWGSSFFTTRSIKDKINPVWSQNGCLSGSSKKQMLVRVCDDKENILQTMAVGVQALRVMFPYHIQLKFKEEFMGAVPEIFFTVVRQSFPMYSIMEVPVRFAVRGLGEEHKNTFITVSLKKELEFPQFIEVDRSQLNTLEKLNKYITSRGEGEEDRIDLIGLPQVDAVKSMSIFKSYLSRKVYLHVFWMNDTRSCFGGNGGTCKLIESRSDFQNILRKVYYQGETFALKKYFEIFNPSHQLEQPEQQHSQAERWKVLSNNYVLRNQLINTSAQRIQELKKAIDSKGKQLVELKKVLKDVKIVNSSLVAKEKLLSVVKGRKQRLNAKEFGTSQLTTALYSRQAELERHKQINAEMSLRMDSLLEVEENQEDLDKELVKNADELLRQQNRIKKMGLMQKGIKRQRQIIGQLEKVFEQGQVAFRINQTLKEQSDKLQQIRLKKQEGLNRVYSMIKEQGKEGGSYQARIRRAQQTLYTLNAQYAKLISL